MGEMMAEVRGVPEIPHVIRTTGRGFDGVCCSFGRILARCSDESMALVVCWESSISGESESPNTL
jgi:hypothetical protein